MKTSVLSPLGIASALRAVEVYTNDSTGEWSGEGDQAQALTALYGKILSALGTIPEYRSFAHEDVKVLNRMATEAGFQIQLNPWPINPNEVGAISLSKIDVQWLTKGLTEDDRWQPYTVCGNKPAFLLKTTADWGMQFFSIEGVAEPLISIPTKSGDTAYLLRTDDPAMQNWRTRFLRGMHIIRSITAGTLARNHAYDGAIIPKVNIDLQPDISWVTGMSYGEWRIGQALQEIKFRMNEVGALDETCTLVTALRGMSAPPRYFRVDGPFMFLIARPGIDVPLTSYLIGEDSMNDPGTIEF